jgi:hypothetical protein
VGFSWQRVAHWMTGGGHFALGGPVWPSFMVFVIPPPPPPEEEDVTWTVPDYLPDFVVDPPASGDRP